MVAEPDFMMRRRQMAAVATTEATWCKMPMDLICDDDITKSDLKVFGYLAHRAGPRGWFYAPISDIISAVNLSDKMIRLACQKLKTKGYLKTQRLGKAYNFWLKFTISTRKRTSEDDHADVFGNGLPNSDNNGDEPAVFGNELPEGDPAADVLFGNGLPDDQPIFGNTLPEGPVTDYRNTTETTTETPAPTTETHNASPVAKAPATRRARPPDPYWDALLEGIGHPPPPSKRGAWNKALKDLKDMGAAPADIIARCAVYRARSPTIDLTPTGLASRWYDIDPVKQTNGDSPNGRNTSRTDDRRGIPARGSHESIDDIRARLKNRAPR